jgi:hypothetical protein
MDLGAASIPIPQGRPERCPGPRGPEHISIAVDVAHYDALIEEKLDNAANVVEIAVRDDDNVNARDGSIMQVLEQTLLRTAINHDGTPTVRQHGAAAVSDIQNSQFSQASPLEMALERAR